MRTTQLQALTTTALLAGACVVPAAASASDTGPTKDVNASIVWVDVSFPATVEVPWEDGTSTEYSTEVWALCTGFFVSNDGDIATAGHCVEADAATEVSAINNVLGELTEEGWDVTGLEAATLDWAVEVGDPTAAVGQPTGVPDGIFSGGSMMTAQIVDFQGFGAGDNALLRVADLEGTPGLPIGQDTPAVGDPVTSVGFAGSVSQVSDAGRQRPSYKFGTVSSRQYTEKGVPNTEIDAAVTQGMSGGPTLGEDDTVIGINSFGIHGESQSFNFVTDTETLRDFLTRNGVDLVSDSDAAGQQPEDVTPAGPQAGPQDRLTAATQTTDTSGADTATSTSSGAESDDAETADTAALLSQGPPAAAEPAIGDEGMPPLAWVSVGLAGVLLLAGGALAGRYLARTRQPA